MLYICGIISYISTVYADLYINQQLFRRQLYQYNQERTCSFFSYSRIPKEVQNLLSILCSGTGWGIDPCKNEQTDEKVQPNEAKRRKTVENCWRIWETEWHQQRKYSSTKKKTKSSIYCKSLSSTVSCIIHHMHSPYPSWFVSFSKHNIWIKLYIKCTHIKNFGWV